MPFNFRFKMNTNGLTSAAIQRRCMVVKPKMSAESQNRFMMGRGFTQRVPLQRCELISCCDEQGYLSLLIAFEWHLYNQTI